MEWLPCLVLGLVVMVRSCVPLEMGLPFSRSSSFQFLGRVRVLSLVAEGLVRWIWTGSPAAMKGFRAWVLVMCWARGQLRAFMSRRSWASVIFFGSKKTLTHSPKGLLLRSLVVSKTPSLPRTAAAPTSYHHIEKVALRKLPFSRATPEAEERGFLAWR